MNSTVVKVLLIIALIIVIFVGLDMLGILEIGVGGDNDTPDALSALLRV